VLENSLYFVMAFVRWIDTDVGKSKHKRTTLLIINIVVVVVVVVVVL
jgi:hypothetical protein